MRPKVCPLWRFLSALSLTAFCIAVSAQPQVPAAGARGHNQGDVSALSARQARILSALTPLFPDGIPDHEQPEIRNSTEWNVRIWSLNESSECTYENFDPACRGHTLYVTVADDNLGGKTFGFQTKKAFRWVVDGISTKETKDSAGSCALIELRERVPSKGAVNGWRFRKLSVCARPDGFVR